MSGDMTPMTTIFDQLTGKEITRKMTDSELEQYKIDQANMEEEAVKLEAKIAAKASAIAKLESLGLSEEEAKALLG